MGGEKVPGLVQFALDSAASFFRSLTLKEVIGAFWAPFSIFAGAFSAFAFNNRRATRERIDKEVIEGNLALSVLMKFLNHQFLYKRNYIDPHQGAPDAWFRIMPGPPLDNGIRVELNKNNLGFLLQSSGAVWQQTMIEEERYHQVKGAIENRNALLEKAWQKLEEAGFEHGSKIPASEIEKALGPVLFQQLKQISEALIEQVTLNVLSSGEAMTALRTDLVRMYPGRPFINAVLPPSSPPNPPSVATAKPASEAEIARARKGHRQPTGRYIPHEKGE
ncbi:hypothetical protein CV770_02355 [Bradyrhizobium sp. AC87j1]|nr:hypothetical protein CV770_02355 [Bradyrhizobium sp. AC87j1]